MDRTAEEQDRADIHSALLGNDAAYARLVRRHEESMARQMWRFTRNLDEHEQLVHDVFVEAYFSLSRYSGKAPFPHWLHRIGTHVGYGHWRKQARARKMSPVEKLDQLAAPSQTTEESREGVLYNLLERMDPEDRLVLTLTYYEDLNAKQIAQQMGWTHVMTRMRLSRARKKLKGMAMREGL